MIRARISSWTDTPFSLPRRLSSTYTCESRDCMSFDLTIRRQPRRRRSTLYVDLTVLGHVFESTLKIGHRLELRCFAVPFRPSDHWTRFGYQSFFDDLFLPDFQSFFDGLHHVIPGLLVKDRHEVLFLWLRHRIGEPCIIPVLNSLLQQDFPNEVG